MEARKKDVRVLSDERIECTDSNHMWMPHTGGRQGRGWWRRQQCPRCRVKRYQELDRYGDITKPWRYDYSEAPDYLVKGGRLTEHERASNRLTNTIRQLESLHVLDDGVDG